MCSPAADQYTTECIGLHATPSGSRFEALEPMRQLRALNASARWAKAVAHGHASDHRDRRRVDDLADDFQQEVEFFGIRKLPELRIASPKATGVAERFIRTLKENVLCVRRRRHDRGAHA